MSPVFLLDDILIVNGGESSDNNILSLLSPLYWWWWCFCIIGVDIFEFSSMNALGAIVVDVNASGAFEHSFDIIVAADHYSDCDESNINLGIPTYLHVFMCLQRYNWFFNLILYESTWVVIAVVLHYKNNITLTPVKSPVGLKLNTAGYTKKTSKLLAHDIIQRSH